MFAIEIKSGESTFMPLLCCRCAKGVSIVSRWTKCI
jgi:hypothetical protein